MKIKVGLFVRFVHFVSDARLHKGCVRERAIVIEHTHSFFFFFFLKGMFTRHRRRPADRSV